MAESDGAAAQTARILEPEVKNVPGIVDPYIREQLEKRRDEIKILLSSIPTTEPATATAPFVELLEEVDSAVQRMDAGTYGICDVCHDTVEKERLIADPLVRLCLDHLSSDEQRALERDLELASQVQRGLMPQSDAEFRDWRIHYQYKPAGMVSGDYFDLIAPANDGDLIFLLGDVSGKGVAASLLMTHLHAMFRTLASANMELCKLIEMANRLFCQSTTAGQYATLVCGRAGRSGEIELASAGHAPALVISSNGVKELGSTGLPLGLFATGGYTIHRLRLEPGDSVLLFTDGISEANDGSGREYGVHGISAAVAGRHGWPPKELVAACLGDVRRHSAGVRQADDQTLMAIQKFA
ncbi:MAG TPA: SpoIIE family protein phosphatase [Candidatus Acidoferrales bacterium]|jgi:sigma-B regulation protein RsbU (phosphoserine phosphatase)|nr:SpoIIE family protein phosphatase [Candidatus Acidoferrales bacterium]